MLLIDDDPFNIFSLKLILQNFFSENDIDICYLGGDALELVTNYSKNKSNENKCIKCNNYWIIITDINMNDMDGFEVTE